MKFRPARSSVPMAGGVGVSGKQHDEFMMLASGFVTNGSSWSKCPRPMPCPISCSTTRVKLGGVLKALGNVAALSKITYPRVKLVKTVPLTVELVHSVHAPPPSARTGGAISSLGSSNVMTPPVKPDLGSACVVVPANWRINDALGGFVHAANATPISVSTLPDVSGDAAVRFRRQLTGVAVSASAHLKFPSSVNAASTP